MTGTRPDGVYHGPPRAHLTAPVTMSLDTGPAGPAGKKCTEPGLAQ